MSAVVKAISSITDFSACAKTAAASQPAVIKVGSTVPDVKLTRRVQATVPVSFQTLQELSKCTLLITGQPFPISDDLLPEYVKIADELRKAGIEQIACAGVSSPDVMRAWTIHHKADGLVSTFPDPLGKFTRAMGLSLENLASRVSYMVIKGGTLLQIECEAKATPAKALAWVQQNQQMMQKYSSAAKESQDKLATATSTNLVDAAFVASIKEKVAKQKPMLKAGDAFPDVQFSRYTTQGLQTFSTLQAVQELTLLVFVPHAFSPTCDVQLPSYIAMAGNFKSMGVKQIAFVAVNSPEVMKAWLAQHKAEGVILDIPDASGDLTCAAGLAWETIERGFNIASVRAYAFVNKGQVLKFVREGKDTPGQCVESTAVKAFAWAQEYSQSLGKQDSALAKETNEKVSASSKQADVKAKASDKAAVTTADALTKK